MIVHRQGTYTFRTSKCTWDMINHVQNACCMHKNLWTSIMRIMFGSVYGLHESRRARVKYRSSWNRYRNSNGSFFGIVRGVHTHWTISAVDLHQQLILPTGQIINKRKMRMKKKHHCEKKICVKKSYRIFSSTLIFYCFSLCAATEATIITIICTIGFIVTA